MTTRNLSPAVDICSDLRLYRFAPTDDDCEFYVRAPSLFAACQELINRQNLLGLKPRLNRKPQQLDTVKL